MENTIDRGFGSDVPIQQPQQEDIQEQPEIIVQAEPEEPDSEKPLKRHYRDTGKTRLNQIQREKYQAIEERDRIAAEYQRVAEGYQRVAEENERLRKISEASTSAALSQYESSAHERLERAKERKIQALESGDVKNQVEADQIIATATAELVQLSYDKSKHSIQQAQEQEAYETAVRDQEAAAIREQESYQNLPPEVVNRPIAEAWVRDNDWLSSKSPNFDPELAGVVQQLTNSLDNQLMREGNRHQICTPEYFQYIDNYISQFSQERDQPQNQYEPRREMPMSNQRSPVAPVRSGYNPGPRSAPRTVTLSKDEMSLARASGVSYETFAKYKEVDRMNHRNRDDRRR